MSLQSIARAAFTAIKTIAASAVVPVAYKTKTCNGLMDTTTQGTALSMDGNKGETSATVRVDASELDTPAIGDTLTINGKECFAGDVRMDSCGAILTIMYTQTRPNTEAP